MITIKKISFSDHIFTDVTFTFKLTKVNISLVNVDFFKTSVRINEDRTMTQLCTQLKYYFRELFSELCKLHSDEPNPRESAFKVLQKFNQQNLTIRKKFRGEGFERHQKRILPAFNNLTP